MTTLPEEVLASKTNLTDDGDMALKDGLRILARIIVQAYLESHGQVGGKEETLDGGTYGIEGTN